MRDELEWQNAKNRWNGTERARLAGMERKGDGNINKKEKEGLIIRIHSFFRA